MAKFKVELEIDLEYDLPEGCPTTPYTRIGGYIDKNGNLVLVTDYGKVKAFNVKKFERQPE